MEPFASVPEQPEAKRLLAVAAGDPAHAYLFHGPRGVGKRALALAFAAVLLGDERRVLGSPPVHPDLRIVEPLGEMIRIDDIRALHHDLHMRPFEGTRRIYLLLGADLLNDDAADALLKDLEEPPSYATIVLVADELGPLSETIRSRCQLVPFRRLSEGAVRSWISERAPELDEQQTLALARVAGGRLDRAETLLDADARERRAELVGVARATYRDRDFEPSDATQTVLAAASARGGAAKAVEEEAIAELELTAREAEQRVRRAQRGAERESLLLSLRGARRLVSRPRRRVGRGSARGRQRRPPRRPPRRRRARHLTLGRGRSRILPRDVASCRGVQRQSVAGARRPVCPPTQGVCGRRATSRRLTGAAAGKHR